jgi:hypothetical protein
MLFKKFLHTFHITVLILLYSSVVISPSLPLLDYVLRYDYYVSNYCVNKAKPKNSCCGKCQLTMNISKTSKETGKDSGTRNVQESLEIFSHITQTTEIDLINLHSLFSQLFYFLTSVILDGFTYKFTPPPRIIS